MRTIMGKKTAYLGSVALFALGVGLTPVAAAEADAEEEEAKPVKVSAPVVVVQDQDDDDDLLEEEDDDVEEIVTTGSRLRRSEFNSASPVQIIGGAQSRELGLFDTGSLLQRTNQSTGQQIDNTFSGFVLDNGFGAQTVQLRGLGAERTLVMINGRRLVSAGNGGAPGVPDLSLIPNIAVEQFEQLLDGASAVYGSDAMAGVVNILLRDDVDGFEFEVNGALPEFGGGEEFSAGALWGKQGDNFSITVAAEYRRQENQSLGQNDFANDCNEILAITEDGQRLRTNRSVFTSFPGSTPTRCANAAHARLIEGTGFFGSVYFDPNGSNIGLGNFSETSTTLNPFARSDINFIPFPEGNTFVPDGNNDGITDLDFGTPQYNFNLSQAVANQDFIAKAERVNAYAVGTYNLEDDNNTELYFEASYARRDIEGRDTPAQYFPVAPADNPFNPFGVNGISPVAAFFDPGVISFFGLSTAPTTAQLVHRIAGDRDFVENKIEQLRGVAGVRGNIGFLDNFGAGNWTYDASLSYQRSDGFETQTGISEENGELSLNNTVLDANGVASCQGPNGEFCLPINFFENRFFDPEPAQLTDEEADYLLIDRLVETDVEMVLANVFVQGDVFTLPWNDNTVPLVVGYEYREDTITTTPNDVAREGLIFGFFRDLGSNGSRDLHEIFAETRLTLLAGVPGADLLEIEGSGRWTKEEFSPGEFTYSVKGQYRPVEFITVRGTYGTSFRAPNLRERFIGGLTGFTNVADPCVVPEGARDQSAGPGAAETYVAANDTREPNTLDSCRATGVDPTTLGLRDPGNPAAFEADGVYNLEVATVGSGDPQPETSTAWTAGIVFEQPFTDAFNLTVSATYYDIQINGGVTESSLANVTSSCYQNFAQPAGTSSLCRFIERDNNGFIDFVGLPFANSNGLSSKGWDFNLVYQQDFEIGTETIALTVDASATYLEERIDEPQVGDVFDFTDTVNFPHWRANGIVRFQWEDLSVIWESRWISGGGEFVTNEFVQTDNGCVTNTPVSCRDIDFTENYDVHTISAAYQWNDYTFVAGIENLLNDGPSRTSGGNGNTARGNFPLGVGYQLEGRTFFASARLRF